MYFLGNHISAFLVGADVSKCLQSSWYFSYGTMYLHVFRPKDIVNLEVRVHILFLIACWSSVNSSIAK
jgi:hypothetical protein